MQRSHVRIFAPSLSFYFCNLFTLNHNFGPNFFRRPRPNFFQDFSGTALFFTSTTNLPKSPKHLSSQSFLILHLQPPTAISIFTFFLPINILTSYSRVFARE
ncbi:hypothetical protein Hanom_Chr14g01323781 [Helianthus anomalus]